MKYFLSTLLLLLSLLAGLDAESQNNARFPTLHERIVQAKLREIRIKLSLDQSTFEQFRPIYLKYDREISGIDFRQQARLMKIDADSLSTEEADHLIVNQLENIKKLIAIREKYYKEFKSVLPPQKIIKLYQTEAELRKKVLDEMKRRLMSR
ncbi:MAG: hypothetical protein M1292_03290 [Bacteroidetes bacterium]|nr:hypothetical protein [Bacteroidota bacterium]